MGLRNNIAVNWALGKERKLKKRKAERAGVRGKAVGLSKGEKGVFLRLTGGEGGGESGEGRTEKIGEGPAASLHNGKAKFLRRNHVKSRGEGRGQDLIQRFREGLKMRLRNLVSCISIKKKLER